MIGPALTSGRISDFAVNEAEPGESYVVVSSGGVARDVRALDWLLEVSGAPYTPGRWRGGAP